LARASTEFAFLETVSNADVYVSVGRNAEKIDSVEKINAKAKYLEDIKLEGLLHARVVGSTASHGIIKRIDLSEAEKVSGVVGFITSKDVPGESLIGYIPSMPVLATEKVRYYGEPIALVVARDSESAIEASTKVRVDIEPLPLLLDPIQSLQTHDLLIHQESGSNVAGNMKISKGDAEGALEEAPVVVQNDYKIAPRDHGYIERESAIGIPEEDGGLTILTQHQNPHVVQRNVSRVLSIPTDRVRIVQPFIGGSFGGKNDMGIILGSQVALATQKLRKPVLLHYSREESLQRHAKSESAIVTFASAASSEGDLLAAKVKIIIDSGAYATRSPAILWRAGVEITGPYEVPNFELEGYCVYTNKVYIGGLRGFGSATAAFVAENQMDALASKLNMDPVEFRIRNMIRPGSITVTGQKIDDNIEFERALRELARSADYSEKRKSRPTGGAYVLNGIGVGCAWHGIGVGWGYGAKKKGKIVDWSSANVSLGQDGKVTVETGIVEMGQGTNTAFAQIASEILDLPLSMISIKTGSSIAPETGGTHASRGLSHGGLAVEKACKDLKKILLRFAAERLGCEVGEVTVERGQILNKVTHESISWNELVSRAQMEGVQLKVSARVEIPRGEFDPENGVGHTFPTYSFSATIAEVEVDTLTGDVKVVKLWPGVAAGKIVNPAIAEDQIVGGTVFGLGAALMEEIMFDDNGRVANSSFSTYMLPTAPDVPEIAKPVLVEDISKHGVFGAKGIGEVIPSSIAPAVACAVYNATGILMTEMPLTKERVWRKLKYGASYDEELELSACDATR
jgi:CO/xanthine dehydrogenase Mo-binding subunit